MTGFIVVLLDLEPKHHKRLICTPSSQYGVFRITFDFSTLYGEGVEVLNFLPQLYIFQICLNLLSKNQKNDNKKAVKT